MLLFKTIKLREWDKMIKKHIDFRVHLSLNPLSVDIYIYKWINQTSINQFVKFITHILAYTWEF